MKIDETGRQLSGLTLLRHLRCPSGAQVGEPELSNYVKCPTARWIGGPKPADYFPGFCILQRILCIVRLSAFCAPL
jgi:hypothetical protein